MRIAVFGGSFNPPHKGHLNSALAALRTLRPDRFLVIPDYLPPHKEMAEGSPTPEERLELCRLNFSAVSGAEISDLEIRRGGKSYTADTLRSLHAQYPDAELVLLLGTDMLLTLDTWYDAEYILRNSTVAPFQRAPEELDAIRKKALALHDRFGTKMMLIGSQPFEASSTQIRAALAQRGGREYLTDEVYSYIIRNRLYGARPDFDWLREKSYAMLKPKRIPHVRGCEAEARRLAGRWGADVEQAAEAAILHDCTKKEPPEVQLALCEKYGITPDEVERRSEKLLHAKTGAAIAAAEFGADEAVVSAICWHTTGRENMSLLEKIIYMADYIEPTRDFPGVDTLRKLAYQDLDAAMRLGLEMSMQDIRAYGIEPHGATLRALNYYQDRKKSSQ